MSTPKDELAFFRELFACSPVGMTVCDAVGQAILVNGAICELAGAPPDAVLTQNYHDLASWKAAGLIAVADEAVRIGRAAAKKITMVTTFGKELTANASFRPFTVGGERYLLATFDDLGEVKKVEDEREKLILELQAALQEIENLQAILPLCSFCKKVRDDAGYWHQVDVYIQEHRWADISHSICPACMKKHYPEVE